MQEAVADKTLDRSDVRRISELFEAEVVAYRRLLRLAVRQNRYMRRHDVARLEANAAEWRRYLPEAGLAKRRRESFLASLALGRGLPPESVTMSRLAELACPDERRNLGAAVAGWQNACADLHRQNSMNGLLARFCIDLIQDETTLFRDGVTGHPAGCYGGDGAPALAANPGVIERKA